MCRAAGVAVEAATGGGVGVESVDGSGDGAIVVVDVGDGAEAEPVAIEAEEVADTRGPTLLAGAAEGGADEGA